MHQTTFRIEGTGPLAAATADRDAAVDLWCNDHCDLLHVTGADAAGFLDAVREVVGVRDELAGDGERVAITDCVTDSHPTVDPHLARHDCVLLPPLSYADGARRVTVLALAPEHLTGLYRDLLDEWRVSVAEKREVTSLGAATPNGVLGAALPSLTDRQRETLTLAVAAGYYEIPRETTTADLADALGVDRRTAEEHLRRAENKLVHAVAGALGLDA
jgi:predicted DNA binding protein